MPLTNVRGYIEAIHDGVTPASAEMIGDLHDETMRLGRLVDALHELSLFDGSLVRRLVGLRQVVFTGKAITVRSDVSANCAVQADFDLLSQALHNLLGNAPKYTPRGGEVSVRVPPDGGNARIWVSNTGDGIAPEDLPFIFKRFYQREKSRTREW